MSGTLTARVGDRGRVVLPAELREQAAIHDGDVLVFVPTPDGYLLMTTRQLGDRIARELAGPSLAEELIAQRRDEVRREAASG